MYIKKLKLKNFRNYDTLDISFSPDKNIIYGDNGQGKTNIIEALYFLQTGRSYRSAKDKETIKFGEDFARIEADFERGGRDNKAVFFIADKKSVKLNGIVLDRLSELVGNINLVIFTPDHLNLIKEGPSVRRNFLDSFISQLNGSYFKNLISYYKVLKHRNNILKTKKMLETISVWDEKLARLAVAIGKDRNDAVEKLNLHINSLEFTGGNENIHFEYSPSLKGDFTSFENIVSQLENNLNRDLEYSMTMTGPHRDDFDIFMNGKDIKKYGSQGQMRSCVLKIKLSECEIIKEKTGEMPPVLLDDILSELDETRRQSFIENIKDRQVIISCTDKEFLGGMEGKYFEISHGGLIKEE